MISATGTHLSPFGDLQFRTLERIRAGNQGLNAFRGNGALCAVQQDLRNRDGVLRKDDPILPAQVNHSDTVGLATICDAGRHGDRDQGAILDFGVDPISN